MSYHENMTDQAFEHVSDLPDLPDHDRRQDDAGVDRPDMRALFSANEVENRSTTVRAHQNNEKDTIGRKWHPCNARAAYAFAQRCFADRETLSRLLQGALVAGQGTYSMQEALHGHSSCAGSEDPVRVYANPAHRRGEIAMSFTLPRITSRGRGLLFCRRRRRSKNFWMTETGPTAAPISL